MDEAILESILLLKCMQDTENICVKDFELVDPGIGEECVSFVVQIFFGNCGETIVEGEDSFSDQLMQWSQFWNTAPSVDVLFMIPKSFPKRPPNVRLIRPMLEHGTGGVMNGYFLRIPRLFKKGWNSNYELPVIIPWIRDCLTKHRAKIDMNTCAMYNAQAFLATLQKIQSLPCAPNYYHKSKYQKEHIVYSGSFAATYLHVALPQGFEYGNKVLLHTSVLEEILRHEMNYLGEAGSTSLALGHGSESNTDDSAMIFELLSHLGFSSFCGVREFTSPEPNIIIVPTETLLSMGVPEGSKIRLTRVSLPQVTSIVVQPHSSSFLELETTNGMEPKEFLEDSLTRYSVLSKGDTVLFDGAISFSDIDIGIPTDGEAIPFPLPSLVYRFTIVSVEPSNTPAGALFSQFASTIDYKMLPAMDAYPMPKTELGEAMVAGSASADKVPAYDPTLDPLLQQFSAESTDVNADADLSSFLPQTVSKPRRGSVTTLGGKCIQKPQDTLRPIRGISFAPVLPDFATGLISRSDRNVESSGVSSQSGGQELQSSSSSSNHASSKEPPRLPVDQLRMRELRAKAALERLANQNKEKD